MGMVFKKKVRRKVKSRKKLKLWRLRESEVKEECAEGVKNKCEGYEGWFDLKRKLLDVASEVCGYSKGKSKHFKNVKANPNILKTWWWWNKDVDVVVCRKRELLRIWKQSRNEEDRKKYCEEKKDATRVVYIAMDQKAQEVVEKVDLCLEYPNKGLGRRKMFLGLVFLKMKPGR